MGTLCYTTSVSLDGYVADATGDFQWGAPNEEVFQFHLDRVARLSAEVLGRNTYELMKYWDAEPEGENWGEQEREFARRWGKVKLFVASSSMMESQVTSPNAELIGHLTLDRLKEIVRDAPSAVDIFGPTVAREALLAGLVVDYQFFVVPKVVGGGLRALPEGANLDLKLVERHEFSNGTVYLRYAKINLT
ncbi:dihydrofolate reductase family protein [Neomicrococcus lactis]|uniref:dihydrofolate reductase family protein n=1 Tax=Neomicrococcus lactis TaxID=732241 RepID=UPI0023019657|nr:deaminase [Neomicrococcus lactis]